ncbi:hypothetical protein [Ligilactobacillus cholophilus]|uniref:hypothetical protein n=1 Tax=Ligilactobacillus cholophilus TaxID=3050131 RepID=UPI0025B191A3|nr:hypothetical protein [Ligilactobacillus cholophilus]
MQSNKKNIPFSIIQQIEGELTLEIKEGQPLENLMQIINQFEIENYSVQPLNTEEVIAHFYEQNSKTM